MKPMRRQKLKNLHAESEQFRRRAVLGFLGIAAANSEELAFQAARSALLR